MILQSKYVVLALKKMSYNCRSVLKCGQICRRWVKKKMTKGKGISMIYSPFSLDFLKNRGQECFLTIF